MFMANRLAALVLQQRCASLGSLQQVASLQNSYAAWSEAYCQPSSSFSLVDFASGCKRERPGLHTSRTFASSTPDDLDAAMAGLSPQERTSVSPGALMSAYPGPFQLPSNWVVQKAGWQQLLKRIITRINIWTVLAWSKRYVPGYKTKEFRATAVDLYKKINYALVKGQLAGLDKLVTPALLLQLRNEIEQRRAAGWHRIEWELVEEPTPETAHVVWGSLYRLNAKAPVAWPQITVRIPSKQKFAAYNKAGALVAGNPEQVLDVSDHWVFERKTLSSAKMFHAVDPPDAAWRLAARLNLKPYKALPPKA